MTSIITGDIINSRKVTTDDWLPALKDLFNSIGKNPKQWEVFRGDSFQLEVHVENALKTCLLIKACIKKATNLDVRLGIGIGQKKFDAANITEANGEAFINSGYAFDTLLKKQTLAIKSPWKEIDEEFNIGLALGLLTMNSWTANSAEFVQTSIENPTLTQKEIGEILNISQAGISKRRKRAGFVEIMKLEKRYRKVITKKIASL